MVDIEPPQPVETHCSGTRPPPARDPCPAKPASLPALTICLFGTVSVADFIWATIQLYHQVGQSTLRSFVRSWILIFAVMLFAVLMVLVSSLVIPLGIIGGFLLGAANAFLIGATLNLTEQAVVGSRQLRWSDLPQCAGQYFWEVISVGFLVWFPLLILQMALQANPYRSLLTTAIFFLLFILLNPVPEVIYQTRQGSAIDILRESYDFVVDNWIEWFLPLAIVFAPFGFSFFFRTSSQAGRMGGLDFGQILSLPFNLLTGWLAYVGLSGSTSSVLVLLFTPILAVLILLFRGHLFAALHGSSRRQRLFRARAGSR